MSSLHIKCVARIFWLPKMETSTVIGQRSTNNELQQLIVKIYYKFWYTAKSSILNLPFSMVEPLLVPGPNLLMRNLTFPFISTKKVIICLFLSTDVISAPIFVQVIPLSVEYSSRQVAGGSD